MKKLNKKSYIISSFLIIIGIILIVYENIINLKEENFIETKIIQHNNNQIEMNQSDKMADELKSDYIAILEIPKIKLKKELYNIDNPNNKVDINIEILKESDIEKGNFILAGHSGVGKTAYFNNLYQLNVGDTINIYYNNSKYTYQIVDIYNIEKTGKALLKRNKLKTTLTMITCHYNTNKQIVFISELIYINK